MLGDTAEAFLPPFRLAYYIFQETGHPLHMLSFDMLKRDILVVVMCNITYLFLETKWCNFIGQHIFNILPWLVSIMDCYSRPSLQRLLTPMMNHKLSINKICSFYVRIAFEKNQLSNRLERGNLAQRATVDHQAVILHSPRET